MDNFNLMPHQAQPVNRVSQGQLPKELAELSESALSQTTVGSNSASVLPQSESWIFGTEHWCAYDGDDAE